MLKDWLGLIGQKQNDEQYEEEFLEKLMIRKNLLLSRGELGQWVHW